MVGRLSTSPCTIGLDIGRASIKAAQVTFTPKGPRLDGALCIRRLAEAGPLTAQEVAGLTRAMDRRGLAATRVTLVAPSDALVSGSIPVPPADSNVPRDRIVQMELSRTYRMAPDAFEFAWWDLPETSSGHRIAQAHAVALPHCAVDETLDLLGHVGLQVQRTVPASLAMLAAAQGRPIDPRRIVAVLDLGAIDGHLVLMHGGRVVHERTLPDFNASTIREHVGSTLGVAPALATHALGHFGLRDEPDGSVACETSSVLANAIEGLSEEVAMSFAYVSHLYPEAELGPLLILGGASNMPGLTHAISHHLELETATITPGSLTGHDSFGTESTDPAVTLAFGAALMTGEVV